MILHIALDDKFIPFLQGLFEEALPGENSWKILTHKPDPEFALRDGNVEVIRGTYFGSEKFRDDLKVVNCIIFHSLPLSGQQKSIVLSSLREEATVIWRGWGYDYYGYLEANGLELLLQETKLLLGHLDAKRPSILRKSPREIIRRVRAGIGRAQARIKWRGIDEKFLARVDYFSCCVPDDHESLQRVLLSFKAEFLPLNYYSVEDVFLRGDNLLDLAGPDILLGNSADPANNHIEAMRVLSDLGMQGRKVVVPLSYGDMEYQQAVLREGENLLGESFVPLVNFMPLSEYNRLVSGCVILVMNHVRQQAIGNISAALMRGGKVYLRPENPIYKYYSRLGVKLFPFSGDLTIADLDEPLNEEAVSNNKRIMLETWSRAQGLKQVRAIKLLAERMDRKSG